ncbi:hypothetical protein HYC85_007821 [Camellia sinensis]|uniref:Uncharacterized protein n=1 Tax=Camellia sinensis TaxID=4442 RepID=A0A7J7HQX3_CAMSI|nr:hypothetical protein HYC85_007821 [Camellia sinensis]
MQYVSVRAPTPQQLAFGVEFHPRLRNMVLELEYHVSQKTVDLNIDFNIYCTTLSKEQFFSKSHSKDVELESLDNEELRGMGRIAKVGFHRIKSPVLWGVIILSTLAISHAIFQITLAVEGDQWSMVDARWAKLIGLLRLEYCSTLPGEFSCMFQWHADFIGLYKISAKSNWSEICSGVSLLLFYFMLSCIRYDLVEMDIIMSTRETSLTEQLLPLKHSFLIHELRSVVAWCKNKSFGCCKINNKRKKEEEAEERRETARQCNNKLNKEARIRVLFLVLMCLYLYGSKINCSFSLLFVNGSFFSWMSRIPLIGILVKKFICPSLSLSHPNGYVCRCVVLYGLKQSPCAWYECFQLAVTQIVILLLYVLDMMITDYDYAAITEDKRHHMSSIHNINKLCPQGPTTKEALGSQQIIGIVPLHHN